MEEALCSITDSLSFKNSRRRKLCRYLSASISVYQNLKIFYAGGEIQRIRLVENTRALPLQMPETLLILGFVFL